MPRVAIYSRVSTNDKGQTIENQVFDMKRFCEMHQHELIFQEHDIISGTKSKKPGLQRLLEAAERKEYDILVVWSLDRLTREGALRTLQIIQNLSNYGVGFHSLREPHFDTCGPFKDAIIAIAATLARLERDRISERTKASLNRLKSEGRKLGRPEIPVECESKVVSLYKEGVCIPDICKDVTYILPSGKARNVSRSTVYSILSDWVA